MKDDEHLKWVFRQTIKAIEAYNRMDRLPDPISVQNAINNNDEALAKELCAVYGLCTDFLDK